MYVCAMEIPQSTTLIIVPMKIGPWLEEEKETETMRRGESVGYIRNLRKVRRVGHGGGRADEWEGVAEGR